MAAPLPSRSLPDPAKLRNKLLALQMRFASLQGRHDELLQQQKTLISRIALAKARIELAPLAAETFKYLQEKAHARAVGEFEDLLSAFVTDVLPEAGNVRLELGTERGAPALDILLDNNGNMEDILDGNGGGLTNVIVTALTYGALARTKNRAFVTLDEPDCWLKASRVPDFTRVIAQVANPQTSPSGEQSGGFQTLMISHNSVSLMDEGAHILTLSEEDGIPSVESTSGFRAWASNGQEGLRWIEVENFRRHLRTRVPLCPGLNVLAGDVNLGKSTLFVTALRAIAYGDVSDSMVRHGANQATVRVGLENEVVLELVRYRKTSGFKTIFRKYVAGALTNEGPMEGRSVPGFVTEILRIERVDDLDIQLRSQKEPVFLLNEAASRRARLLSVGRESGLLQLLIEKHRLALKRDREMVRNDEQELNGVNRTLAAMAPLGSLSAMVPLLTGLLEDLQAGVADTSRLAALCAKLEPLQARALLAQQESGRLGHELHAPALLPTRELSQLIARLAGTYPLAQLPALDEPPGAPALRDTVDLKNCIKQLAATAGAERILEALPAAPGPLQQQPAAKLDALIRALEAGQACGELLAKLPPAPAAAALADVAALSRTVILLDRQAQAGKEFTVQEKTAAQAEASAAAELHALMDALGTCPVCSKPFGDGEAPHA